MQPFSDISPLWDLSQPSAFSTGHDDEFFTLLQKQYPPTAPFDSNGFSAGINPQSISHYSLSTNGITPPSEESSNSPSPPNTTNNSNGDKDDQDASKRRRVSSDDSDDDQPTHKSQHTTGSDRKGSTSRRKASGSHDDARLMKRKEQNRAAQRAFRERKEKHVKDLEDKVAALEAKNDQAQSENENLRDLLSRLQSENVTLKQQSFTFSVPKDVSSSSNPNFFGSNAGASSSGSVQPSQHPPASGDSFDWSSLTTLDPNMLSLLDDSPQTAAAGDNLSMDFGFGSQSTGPYTTIANNPDYMTFASYFDPSPPESNNNTASPYNFDMNAISSSTWPGPSTTSPANHISFTDMFGTYGANVDFEAMVSSTPSLTSNSVSPISHTSGRSPSTNTSSPNPNTASSSFTTIRESSAVDDDGEGCPKTRADAARKILLSGSSMFAPSPKLTVKNNGDATARPTIMCQGSTFPKTALSDKNVPLMDVWRDITSNPEYKGVDINELCEEFSCKAKCDGTKVVLEPQVVDDIKESLTLKKKQIDEQQKSAAMRQ